MLNFTKTKVFFSSFTVAMVILSYGAGDAGAATNSTSQGKTAQSEKIYKSVGPNGEVIYSDKPSPGSKEIRLPKDDGYQPVPTHSFTPYQPPMLHRKRVKESVTITSPSDGETIRNPAGEVTVSVSLGSPLRGGQSLKYVVDGKTVYTGPRTHYRLNNVFRGTHVLTVILSDSSGTTKSSPVTFYVHRPTTKHIQMAPP